MPERKWKCKNYVMDIKDAITCKPVSEVLFELTELQKSFPDTPEVMYRIELDWDDSYCDIWLTKTELETEEEATARELMEKAFRENQEAAEKATYERLKKKYG